MAKRIRVGVIFGGRSVEHDVSLVSARSVLRHLDPGRYEVIAIGITRAGKWVTAADPGQLIDRGLDWEGAEECVLPADPAAGGFIRHPRAGAAPLAEPLDVVFPVLHGGQGEDGTLQGLLELADLPYVGAGVMASSVGMDKDMMKRVFREAGLPVVASRTLLRSRWPEAREGLMKELPAELGFPCFVKPANTGSSVGISKARDARQLADGIVLAFRYDRKAVVEAAVDAREIECSVLGNDDPIASVPGEIVPCNEFYDYEAKYLDEGSRLIIPAELPADRAEEVRRVAVEAFRAVDGAGMARVDFFLDRKSGRLVLNELNTIPGFTPISMYPKLWEAAGIPYSELLDRLILLALERHREKRSSVTDFQPSPGGRNP
ncbi:MAG TPA: D-alanine--D-alanine ligase family protein [Candidatus Polarisedimenticolia bacterium]|jgi:D-alanine-D-alanine ligase|nr:D-alanine--D-alanine ligase family protein [Candidatus Polarisedimenticolia bacterium]